MKKYFKYFGLFLLFVLFFCSYFLKEKAYLVTTYNEVCVLENSQRSEACFDEKLRSIVREKGISSAFNFLAQKYDDGTLPAACHWASHKIGEEAYFEQQKGKPLVITPETYYCGYGFYHGYLEVMLRENPDPIKQKKFVTDFCDSIQQNLGGEARDNCYHGIGSGYTGNHPDKKFWGKEEELVKPGLAICEQLFANTREWEMCTTGVYAVLAKFKSANEYGFKFDSDNPLMFCENSMEKFQRACYGELSAKLGKLINGDLSKLSKYIINTDTQMAKLVVDVVSSVLIQDVILQDNQDNFITECHTFKIELQPSCIDGLVWGFLYHGRINEEHIKAIRFCESKMFNEKERDFCYQRLIAHAKNMYSVKKFNNICELIDKRYGHYCQENLTVQPV